MLFRQNLCGAEAGSDQVPNYLRKRAPFYAVWFTVPRIAARLRALGVHDVTKMEVTDDDLQFATIVYDAIIYYQDHFFGEMLQNSWEDARKLFVPRRRYSFSIQLFDDMLPERFTAAEMQQSGLTEAAARSLLQRWYKSKFVEPSTRPSSQRRAAPCGCTWR